MIIPPSYVIVFYKNYILITQVLYSKMKLQAGSYFWWPLLDGYIEVLAKSCNACLSSKDNPVVAPLHP